MVQPSAKTTVAEVYKLLGTLGLPIYAPGGAGTPGTAGFTVVAWGGRTGGQRVKAATVVEAGYRCENGLDLTAGELRDEEDLQEVREHFGWIVEKADRYGYDAEWSPSAALIRIRRS
ncbi:hypothetical protein ACFVVA_40275 [Kitasatospora sp. NPDC058048]|uniref:hypothetical protein n=1 Tax=Kitasatospora sp. NPDC058048 TaxID=3346313 RepID=UPI0036DDCE9D